MKTIVVTGGAGFIGSNLVGELLSRNYRVIAVDNFDEGLYSTDFKERNIKEIKENKNFVLYRVDIRDKEALREVFEKEKPEYVAHLAARPSVRNAAKDPYPYISINIEGTLNILEFSSEFGVKNLVIASSSSVYGDDKNTPWNEENMADKHVSPYGVTKRATELLAYTYQRNHGLNVTCLRYFNAYGENNRPDLVPYIWGKAILEDKEIEISGDGSRERDYTYVGDVVDATIRAIEKPLGFEIINIGHSHPVSLKDLLTVFENVSGKKANVKSRPSNSVSMERTYADISKAKRLLDWEPKVSIEEGVKRLLTWLEKLRS